jgi:SAM-dependent methyltransferase
VSEADFDDDQRRRLALRFGGVADIYDRGRPGYAAAAVDWVLDGRRRVLDLGAGTGKLTAALLARGAEVTAVDPSAPMLAVLKATHPEVDARLGSGEATGLPAGAVDAVVIASALHWFDRPAADREIARVLRPGGVVGVFHNRRDKSVPWVAELDQLIAGRTDVRRVQRSELGRQAPLAAEWFTPPEQGEFPFRQTVNAELLVDLFASRSYVIDLDHARQVELLDEIRAFAATHPDLAGQAEFELPYDTVVVRQARLP